MQRRRPPATGYTGPISLLLVLLMLLMPSAAMAQEPLPDPPLPPENPYFGQSPASGSGADKRIGYISLGEADEFVATVSEGIRGAARMAGAQLFECDANFDNDEATLCGVQLANADVQGVLNFQVDASRSGRVCSAYGGLPTIAIDVRQAPCEVSYVGADNRYAGFIAGAALAGRLEEESGCDYDRVYVLEALATGDVNVERTGGLLAGFESACGRVTEGDLTRIDVGGAGDITFEAMTRELEAQPVGGTYVVLTMNEGSAFGASFAAEQVGRQDELRIATQGIQSSLREIACERHWVASAAYFPEQYGNTLIGAMIDLLDGETLPAELLTPHQAVTAANVRESFPQTPAC